jgi:phosphoglycolate phosphatase
MSTHTSKEENIIHQLSAKKPWLVCFDIDDTLVTRAGSKHEIGLYRWQRAIKRVFDITIPLVSRMNYNGMVDWQIGRDLVTQNGVPESVFQERFDDLREALYQEALLQEKNKEPLYDPIPSSVAFARRLSHTPDVTLALLTGNLEKVGWWKLRITGIEGIFPFGCFSDDVQSRVDIAKQMPEKAFLQTGIHFTGDQITVIGDTIHDIRCGKAIGAHTIGVFKNPEIRDVLIGEGADIVVPSLMDRTVLSWFSLDI